MLNDYYYKLPKMGIPKFTWNDVKGEMTKSYGNSDMANIYFEVKDESLLNSLIPPYRTWTKIPPNNVKICEMRGYGLLPPHRDHGISCRVNYYVIGTESITQWHEQKPNTSAWAYPNEKISNMYKLADVDKICDFKADDGDFYLLNVSKIHSVMSHNIKTRCYITFQWFTHPYEEVREGMISLQ